MLMSEEDGNIDGTTTIEYGIRPKLPPKFSPRDRFKGLEFDGDFKNKDDELLRLTDGSLANTARSF
jgi:hypothetical protein